MAAKPKYSFEEFLKRSAELIEKKCPVDAPREPFGPTCLPEQINRVPREGSYRARPEDVVEEVIANVYGSIPRPDLTHAEWRELNDGPVRMTPRTSLPEVSWRPLDEAAPIPTGIWRMLNALQQEETRVERRRGYQQALLPLSTIEQLDFIAAIKVALRIPAGIYELDQPAETSWHEVYAATRNQALDAARTYIRTGCSEFSMMVPRPRMLAFDMTPEEICQPVGVVRFPLCVNSYYSSFGEVVERWNGNLAQMVDSQLGTNRGGQDVSVPGGTDRRSE